jgi:hypothetical protein
MNIHNLRLSQVLWMTLKEAGGPDVNLAYQATGQLVIVSTEDDLAKGMITRVYDVSDLLARIPDFQDAPQLEFVGAGDSSGAGAGFARGGSAGQPEESGRQSRQGAGDIKKLIRVIIDAVEPNSWAENGGLGTIQAFRNLLVVRNSIRVHQTLGGFVE